MAARARNARRRARSARSRGQGSEIGPSGERGRHERPPVEAAERPVGDRHLKSPRPDDPGILTVAMERRGQRPQPIADQGRLLVPFLGRQVVHLAFERFEEPARRGGQGGDEPADELSVALGGGPAVAGCEATAHVGQGARREARAGTHGGGASADRDERFERILDVAGTSGRGERPEVAAPVIGSGGADDLQTGVGLGWVELEVGALPPSLASPVVGGLVAPDHAGFDHQGFELAGACDALDRAHLGSAGARPSCARRRRSRTSPGPAGRWTCPRRAPGRRVPGTRRRPVRAAGRRPGRSCRSWAGPAPCTTSCRSPSVRIPSRPPSASRPCSTSAHASASSSARWMGVARVRKYSASVRSFTLGTSGHTTLRARRAVHTGGPGSSG